MATFFGEVNEISSRAVWWSDSEEEEENELDTVEEDGDDLQPKKTKQSVTSLKPTVRYQTEVLDEQAWATYQAVGAPLVYVSLGKGGKKTPQDGQVILRVKVDAVVGGKNISGTTASLFSLPKDDDDNAYWLLVDHKLANGPETVLFTPRLVDFLLEEVLLGGGTAVTRPHLDLMLISKELSRWDFVQYLSTSTNSSSSMSSRLAQLAKLVDLRPMLPPETLKNDLELALLEYCIVRKNPPKNKVGVAFACLLLPSEYAETLTFLPKVVVESVLEFTFHSHLNIV